MSVQWDMKSLVKAPRLWRLGREPRTGIRRFFYAGPPYRGRTTRVFAYLGLPRGASRTRRVPGIVLVHGGGGTAIDWWVKLWNDRGYAALAMDTCGSVSDGKVFNPARPQHRWAGPRGWGGFDQLDEPVGDQWMYHAVASVILGHSLLRSLPQVDPRRVGITGVSWGAVLMLVAVGVDHRFRFGMPVYGSGFQDQSGSARGDQRAGRRQPWFDLWDPRHYLPAARLPMLWMVGTNDLAFSMHAVCRSARLVKAPPTFCFPPRMVHAHGGPSEFPPELHAFADHHALGRPALARITAVGRRGRRAWLAYRSQAPIKWVELNYTTDAGRWLERRWVTVQAEHDQRQHRGRAVLPAGVTAWYFSLKDQWGRLISSELQQR